MADQLNTGQIVTKPEIIIDPMFPMPPGVLGVRQGDGLTDSDIESFEDDGSEYSLDDVEETTDAGTLAPPSSIIVVGQTARVVNGRTVIDVQIEIEDVPGMEDYEVRYAAANSTGGYTYV